VTGIEHDHLPGQQLIASTGIDGWRLRSALCARLDTTAADNVSQPEDNREKGSEAAHS
jgi:hypothetical protein